VNLTFDLEFDLLVTFVKGHVFTKSEVYNAFLCRENRRHATDGQTDEKDRRTGCNAYCAPNGGPHNKRHKLFVKNI